MNPCHKYGAEDLIQMSDEMWQFSMKSLLNKRVTYIPHLITILQAELIISISTRGWIIFSTI